MSGFLFEWPARLQDLATVAILLFLLWHYRKFAVPLVKFATSYPGLSLVLALLYGMVYGLVGSGLGIPYLFWHDDFWTRSFSSAGATMLLAVVGLIAYYLDPYPGSVGRKTADFLRADEAIRHRIGRRFVRGAALGDTDEPEAGPTRLGWPSYASFAANLLFDPFVVTPLQVWLEPRRDNTLRLQRFLRTARGPFLILLIMPALLPGAWCSDQVPKAAPTGHLEWLLGRAEPPVLDVSRHLGGYLLGLASWLVGIWAGMLFIKILIRLGDVLQVTRPLRSLGRVLAGTGEGPRAGSLYRRISATFGGGPPEPSGSRIDHHPECPLSGSEACPATGCPQGEPDSPAPPASGCRARSEVRTTAVVFAVLFFMTYAALGYVQHLRESGWRGNLFGLPLFDLPPAFAICVLLAVLAMSNAIVAYMPRPWQIPVVLLLIVWLGFANNDPFKNRFERISYADRIPFRERVRESYDGDPVPRNTIEEGDALTGWIKTARVHGGKDLDSTRDDANNDARRPKLVVVAVSGGATRSAYWTAIVLKRLEEELGPEFGQRVRILCGASGGMLGAACYVHYRRKLAEGDPPSDWIKDYLPTRSMDPLARCIALSEIWQAFWPGFVARDRGVVLENNWNAIRYPLVELADLERKGEVPSLIFSPMIVEDGRRLLISNLQLGLSRNAGTWMADSPIIHSAGQQIRQNVPHAGEPSTEFRRLSLSGLEYFRLFDRPAHRDLLLSTAVRMSASFPYVSPAVNLPSDPPRRVVDAGYYDNYGIQVATSWIRKNRDWLARNTSGVLLVQIRDSASVRDRLEVDDPAEGSAGRGFQFFTSPLDAASKARYTTGSFRNDADVVALDSTNWDFRKADGTDEGPAPGKRATFFSTVIFENSAEVTLDPVDFWDELTKLNRPEKNTSTQVSVREIAMSWYLTRAEMDATSKAIPHDPREGNRWSDDQARRDVMRKLHGDVHATDCPDRSIRWKRLDQLSNYERLRNLKTWWRQDPRRP